MRGEDDVEHPLFTSVSRSFAKATRRALGVAAEDEEGNLGPMSQTYLAEHARIGRSTLAGYLAVDENSPSANPTLDAICRMAGTLGVPPAFLLMRPTDWASLAAATQTVLVAAREPEFHTAANELKAAAPTMSPDVARAAIALGELLNTVEDSRDVRLSHEVREFRRAARASTAAVAASIPFGRDGVPADCLPVLLTLCGIVGTTAARN